MHKQPRLNGCGVSHERQYSFLQTDEIFFQFLTICFTAMWLTQLLSFGDVWARSHKNNACHLGLCGHSRARIHPNIGVSKNAICTICRGWMAAGYQRKGNIVFYQLTKYLSILTSRFKAICLWINPCHMGMCWLDCARIHPNIDVSKIAICPICRGWIDGGNKWKAILFAICWLNTCQL